eukprot:gene11760-13219_t
MKKFFAFVFLALVMVSSALQYAQKILGRYTKIVPLTLFRICGKSRSIVLQEYAVQKAKGSRSYDLTLGEDGREGTTNVLEIPAGVKIPEELVILHEHGDHYSLQDEEFFEKYPLAQR